MTSSSSFVAQDANGNKIARYPEDGGDVSGNEVTGVMQDELVLSSEPVQGTWLICVEAQVRVTSASQFFKHDFNFLFFVVAL